MWLKKKDKVLVLAGKDKGKRGEILNRAGEGLFIVAKMNLVKRHQKPSAKYKHGGIIEKEAPIHASNVMILCGKCKGPVRVGRILDGDRRVRACKKCGEVLDK